MRPMGHGACTSTQSAEGDFWEVTRPQSAKARFSSWHARVRGLARRSRSLCGRLGQAAASAGRGKVPFEAHGAKSFPVTMETGTVGSQPENQGEQP